MLEEAPLRDSILVSGKCKPYNHALENVVACKPPLVEETKTEGLDLHFTVFLASYMRRDELD